MSKYSVRTWSGTIGSPYKQGSGHTWHGGIRDLESATRVAENIAKPGMIFEPRDSDIIFIDVVRLHSPTNREVIKSYALHPSTGRLYDYEDYREQCPHIREELSDLIERRGTALVGGDPEEIGELFESLPRAMDHIENVQPIIKGYIRSGESAPE